MIDPIPRWHCRFDNHRRSLLLLREALEQEHPLTQLEEKGVIRQGEAWQNALDARNRMGASKNTAFILLFSGCCYLLNIANPLTSAILML